LKSQSRWIDIVEGVVTAVYDHEAEDRQQADPENDGRVAPLPKLAPSVGKERARTQCNLIHADLSNDILGSRTFSSEGSTTGVYGPQFLPEQVPGMVKRSSMILLKRGA
jgi:hypothetical protein